MSKRNPHLRLRIVMQSLMFSFLRVILKPFLNHRFKLQYHLPNEVKKEVRQGCIILPYHTMSWDPILISSGMKWPVHWVATEAIFRKRFMNFLMIRLLGAIPKTKNRSDMEMLNLIQGYLKLNRPIGIFPEGQQTWDGHGLEAVAGTSKLLRFLKVPVIFVRTEGGFLTKPRWTKKTLPNRMDFHYEIGISAEEIKTMKLSQIEEKLTDFLSYDDYKMQKERRIPLKSKTRAEGMELSLFTCPGCKNLGTMRTKENTLSCQSCGYEAFVDPYGFFEDKGQKPFFETPVEWNRWQQDELASFLDTISKDQAICHEESVTLLTSVRRRPLVPIAEGVAELLDDKISFIAEKGSSMDFPLKEITGLNVFKQQNLEFYYNQVLYRIKFNQSHSSAYKWISLYPMLDKEKAIVE